MRQSVFYLVFGVSGPLDAMLRSLVIGLMGRNGDAEIIAEAKKKFNSHVTNEDPIDANLKSVIFSLSMTNGNEDTFEKLMEVCVEGY